MTDPFEVLGLTRDADAAQARARYLELVRANPPDRQPERFAEIREAYDQIHHSDELLENWLFLASDSGSLERLITQIRGRLRPEKLPLKSILALLDEA